MSRSNTLPAYFAILVICIFLSLTVSLPCHSATVDIGDTRDTTQNLDTLYPGSGPLTAEVTSSGTVDVPTANGAYAITGISSGWNLTNNGIVRGNTGVYFPGIANGVITNNSEILGRTEYGIYIGQNNGTVFNSSTGTITGGMAATPTGIGIRIIGTNATIDNSGAINAYGNGGANGRAVQIQGDGASIINRTGASMIGGYGGTTGIGIYLDSADATVQNDGTIEGHGTNSYGIYSTKAATITNTANGHITGGLGGNGAGIYFLGSGAFGTIDNAGLITGTGAQGVLLTAGGTVTNRTGGLITGGTGSIGVNITGGTGTVTNEAGGTITGGNNGVVISGTGTVTNNGAITGGAVYGVRFSNGNAGTYTTDTTNGGTITGSTAGVGLNFTNASASVTNTINNTGTITATNGSGIRIQDGTGTSATMTNTITNTGTINGSNGAGILIQGSGTFSNSITNSGTITGTTFGISANTGFVTNQYGGTISGAVGISLSGNSGNTLINAGTITGTGGTAVNMGAGADAVTLDTGSVINGTINGGDGVDTLTLLGNGTIGIGQTTNFETLTKDGTGTWTLTGAGSSGGNTIVNQGTLIANGTIGDAVTINSQGTLMGTGSVGNTMNNGTIAPGTSIGTLTINGNYTHGANAIYSVEVNAAGASDRINATGTATINGGTVQVLAEQGSYQESTEYTILHADGGRTGEFSNVTANLAFLDPELTYTAYDVILTLIRNSTNFATVALTRNQQVVASTLDIASEEATGDMRTVIDAVLTLSAPGARFAFDQMGGASYTAFPVIDIDRTYRFMRTLFRRDSGLSFNARSLSSGNTSALRHLAAAGTVASDAGPGQPPTTSGPWGIWVKGYGVSGRRNGDDIASRYTYTIGGIVGGIDYACSKNFRGGISFGYSHTKVDFNDLWDKGKTDSYQIALYGSYTANRWYLDSALYYAHNKYDMTRSIAFGPLYRVADGDYKGHEIAGYAEGGYNFLINGLEIRPMVSFLAVRNHQNGFTETGANAISLHAGNQNYWSLRSALGTRFAYEFGTKGQFTFTPELSARWVHEFGDDRYSLDARFAGYPAGAFEVRSDRMKRDSAVVGIGFTGAVGNTMSFFLHYDANLREKQTDHAVSGGIRVLW